MQTRILFLSSYFFFILLLCLSKFFYAR
jgi:hypothetical protein